MVYLTGVGYVTTSPTYDFWGGKYSNILSARWKKHFEIFQRTAALKRVHASMSSQDHLSDDAMLARPETQACINGSLNLGTLTRYCLVFPRARE